MIENKDFIFHNALYMSLLERFLKQGVSLYSCSYILNGFVKKEEKKGISFRDIDEIVLSNPFKELGGTSYSSYYDEVAGYNFLSVDKLGRGSFISIDKTFSFFFFLSDFNTFPEISPVYEEPLSLSGVCSSILYIRNNCDYSLTENNLIEAIGKTFLLFNEGLILSDTNNEKEHFNRILSTIKLNKDAYYYLIKFKHSKNNLFALMALYGHEELFKFNIDFDKFFKYIKEVVS